MADEQVQNESARITHDPVTERVGQRIRQARKARGLSLAQLGEHHLSRGFLSSVESGRSSISLRALGIVAQRLKLPVSYFVDDAPILSPSPLAVSVELADAALAYGLYLRSQGKTDEALEYALWAAQANIAQEP